MTDAGTVLLPLARAAIAAEFAATTPPQSAAAWLREPGACFVTLLRGGSLRGCIGTLEAHRPLGDDVRANARAAAFADPRFAPLRRSELPDTLIEISLLSALQPLPCAGEQDALAQLRPGVDGLVFECGRWRSTFLPQVWEQLPEPADFLAQLKAKAGLPAHFWSGAVRLYRYGVSKFTEKELQHRGAAAPVAR